VRLFDMALPPTQNLVCRDGFVFASWYDTLKL
jgi:hypothetical protein